MDKMQMATEIGQLEGEVSKTEGQLRELQDKAKSARGNYTGGLVGLAIGLILVLIFGGWVSWLGWLLLVAGGLAAYGGYFNQRDAKLKAASTQKAIDELRAKLATLRAQLAAS